jgi:hypothetical protein
MQSKENASVIEKEMNALHFASLISKEVSGSSVSTVLDRDDSFVEQIAACLDEK